MNICEVRNAECEVRGTHPAPSTAHPAQLGTSHSALRTLMLVAALLILGAAVRVMYLDVPPLDFHPTRQYRSALMARAMSDAALAPLSAVERGNAVAMAQAQATIEPELMEPLAAWLYDVAGKEDLRLPRAISIMGWLLAALSTFWLVALSVRSAECEVRSSPSALRTSFALRTPHFALIAVLFLPYTIDASRAFMPDPWMVGLTIAALALTMRHHVAPAVWTLVARVLVAAAAMYVKPMAVFFVAPVFLVMDVARLGLVRGVLVAGVSMAAAAAPAAWHYVSLINSGNPVAQDRFLIELWSRPTYWSGWFRMLARVTNYLWIVAIIGLILGRGPLRILLAAASLGYIAMGLMFPHHISTHDYYSLPLIPIVAAAVALLVSRFTDGSSSERRAPSSERRGFSPAVVTAAAAVAILALVVVTTGTRDIYGDVDRARQTAADYERIGELTGHSPRVLSLDGAYGYPLSYHARITTSQLTLSIDRAVSDIVGRTDSSLRDQIRAGAGQYFVGTIQTELDAAPDARDWLAQRHALVDRAGTESSWRHVVFDLTTPPALRTPHPALRTDAGASSPIGSLDAPPPNVVIQVAETPMLLQGWALDETELDAVEVVMRTSEGDRVLGHATRAGKRPDIAAAFATFPGLDRSSWFFALYPEDKPQSEVTLVVRAVDTAGTVTVLGQRTVK